MEQSASFFPLAPGEGFGLQIFVAHFPFPYGPRGMPTKKGILPCSSDYCHIQVKD